MNAIEGRTRKEMITLREREILSFIAKGFDNEEIAEGLDIPLEEVLRSQAELLGKMDFRNIPLAIKSMLGEKLIGIAIC
jgi:FixJ family two-component response regulator